MEFWGKRQGPLGCCKETAVRIGEKLPFRLEKPAAVMEKGD